LADAGRRLELRQQSAALKQYNKPIGAVPRYKFQSSHTWLNTADGWENDFRVMSLKVSI